MKKQTRNLVIALVAALGIGAALPDVAEAQSVRSIRGADVADPELAVGNYKLIPDQAPLPGSTARMLWLLGGGLAFMLLVRPLGFVVAGTLCGIGVARAFDAPLGLRNVAMNLAIALAFWLLFAQVLGVGLGPALAWPF